MADDFSERYGDLLQGSYDCVDRIVLNAFYSLGRSAGGFREWWRRLNNGSEDKIIAVTDDGPGIAPDDQARIFERFYRVSGSAALGTGLGLARTGGVAWWRALRR